MDNSSENDGYSADNKAEDQSYSEDGISPCEIELVMEETDEDLNSEISTEAASSTMDESHETASTACSITSNQNEPEPSAAEDVVQIPLNQLVTVSHVSVVHGIPPGREPVCGEPDENYIGSIGEFEWTSASFVELAAPPGLFDYAQAAPPELFDYAQAAPPGLLDYAQAAPPGLLDCAQAAPPELFDYAQAAPNIDEQLSETEAEILDPNEDVDSHSISSSVEIVEPINLDLMFDYDVAVNPPDPMDDEDWNEYDFEMLEPEVSIEEIEFEEEEENMDDIQDLIYEIVSDDEGIDDDDEEDAEENEEVAPEYEIIEVEEAMEEAEEVAPLYDIIVVEEPIEVDEELGPLYDIAEVEEPIEEDEELGPLFEIDLERIDNICRELERQLNEEESRAAEGDQAVEANIDFDEISSEAEYLDLDFFNETDSDVGVVHMPRMPRQPGEASTSYEADDEPHSTTSEITSFNNY